MEFQKYNVKEKKKKKKVTKIIKNIYMKFALKKIQSFFFGKVIVGYKSENYKSNRGLKIFLKIKKERKNDRKNSKIYLGLSLVVWVLWGQFIFS